MGAGHTRVRGPGWGRRVRSPVSLGGLALRGEGGLLDRRGEVGLLWSLGVPLLGELPLHDLNHVSGSNQGTARFGLVGLEGFQLELKVGNLLLAVAKLLTGRLELLELLLHLGQPLDVGPAQAAEICLFNRLLSSLQLHIPGEQNLLGLGLGGGGVVEPDDGVVEHCLLPALYMEEFQLMGEQLVSVPLRSTGPVDSFLVGKAIMTMKPVKVGPQGRRSQADGDTPVAVLEECLKVQLLRVAGDEFVQQCHITLGASRGLSEQSRQVGWHRAGWNYTETSVKKQF